MKAIRKAKLKVVVDPLHGAGRGYIETVLAKAGADSHAFVASSVRSGDKALPLIDLLAIFDDLMTRKRSATTQRREERP